jgi:hypothetical protein
MFDNVRSLQFGFFTVADPGNTSELFRALTGQEPDSIQRVRPPQAPFPVEVVSSVIGSAMHRVQVHAGRFDYFIEAGTDNPLQRSVPAIPGRDALLSNVVGRVQSVVDQVSSYRAAIVLRLAEQMNGPVETSHFFNELFSGRNDFSSDLDLMFQTNRRTAVGGRQINRLLRWNTEVATFESMIGSGPSSAGHRVVASAETHYVVYNIDVNSVPVGPEQMASDELRDLLRAMSEIASDLGSLQRLEDLK